MNVIVKPLGSGVTPIGNSVVSSIAELKALPVALDLTVFVESYYGDGIYGGGWFTWEGAETTPDDGGIFIQRVSGGVGRWIRLFVGNLDCCMWGCRPDSVKSGGRFNGTDNGPMFQKAADYCGAHHLTLYVLPGSYRFMQPGPREGPNPYNFPVIIAPTNIVISGTPGESFICLDMAPAFTAHTYWMASANFDLPAVQEISTPDLYERIHIDGLTIQGLWEESVGPQEFRFTPFRMFNYARVEFSDVRWENIYGAAMLCRWNGSYYCCDCRFDNVARACIHCLGTPICIASRNWVRRCDDDSVALQSLNPADPDRPQRGRIVCCDNIIEQCEGIHCVGSHEMIVTGNFLHLCHGTGMTIGLTGPQTGAGGKSNVLIEGNVVLNQIKKWHEAGDPPLRLSEHWGQGGIEAGVPSTDGSTGYGDAFLTFGGMLVSGYQRVNVNGTIAAGVAVAPANTITNLPPPTVDVPVPVVLPQPFANGTRVIYDCDQDILAIGGLVHRQAYWIINRTATTFQLANTVGGPAISLTSLGTAPSVGLIRHKFMVMPGEYMNATNGVLSAWGLDNAATDPQWGWLNTAADDEVVTGPPVGFVGGDYTTGGSYNWIVKGNIFARTLPINDAADPVTHAGATHYEDWGYGPLLVNNVGFRNPWVDTSTFHDWAIRCVGDTRNTLIEGNIIFGFRPDMVNLDNDPIQRHHFLRGGIFLDKTNAAFDEKTHQRLKIVNNTIVDVGFGIRTLRHSSPALANWDVIIEGNLIDCDPFLKSPRRNAALDGTWQISGVDVLNPVCLDLAGVMGWTVRNNELRNAYWPINPANQLTLAGMGHVENNTLRCDPVALGPNAGNKGIADVPPASPAFQYIIWGSDPTLDSWNKCINCCPRYAPSVPTVGKFVTGHTTYDNGSSAALAYKRLTLSSTHVVGDDWAPVLGVRQKTISANTNQTAYPVGTVQANEASEVLFDTPITADRTLTLATGYRGASMLITRATTAAGAFNWIIKNTGGVTLTSLALGQYCRVSHNGTDWYLSFGKATLA